MERFQVMGFSAVLKVLPRLFFHFHQIQRWILQKRPEALIFIDYPDFTMRLEKALRKKGYQGKIIHYVCPTVWAWRSSRIKTLSKTLDLLLAIFPFEKECFLSTPLPVTYVGHPLLSLIDTYSYTGRLREQFAIQEKKHLIAIFPGSRRHEIDANLPLQLQAVEQYCKEHPHACVAVSIANPGLEKRIRETLQKSPLNPFLIPAEFRYDLMKEANIALATSGTVTLELALHSTPTVVTYPINALNYFLGKHLFGIHLPHFCIVNIIAGKTIFPECIERTLSPDQVFQALKELVPSTCREGCEEVKKRLQHGNASEKAAEAITHLLQGGV